MLVSAALMSIWVVLCCCQASYYFEQGHPVKASAAAGPSMDRTGPESRAAIPRRTRRGDEPPKYENGILLNNTVIGAISPFSEEDKQRSAVTAETCTCQRCNTTREAFSAGEYENVIYNKPVKASSFLDNAHPPCAANNGILSSSNNNDPVSFTSGAGDDCAWLIIDMEYVFTFDHFIIQQWYSSDGSWRKRLLGVNVLADSRVIYGFPRYNENGVASLPRRLKIDLPSPESARFITLQKRDDDLQRTERNYVLSVINLEIWVCKMNTYGTYGKWCQPCPSQCDTGCNNYYGCSQKPIVYNFALFKKTMRKMWGYRSLEYGSPDNVVNARLATRKDHSCYMYKVASRAAIVFFLDLGATYLVRSVAITSNQYCCPDCPTCTAEDFLKDFYVLVIPSMDDNYLVLDGQDDRGYLCFYQHAGLPSRRRWVLDCKENKVGRAITIQSYYELGFCELEAYGYRVDEVTLGSPCDSSFQVCARNTICDNGFCKKRFNAACTEDSECREGLLCDAGKCKVHSGGKCETDTICATGLQCVDNFCRGLGLLNKCQRTDQCPANSICDHFQRCVKRRGDQCRTTFECTPGAQCLQGTCTCNLESSVPEGGKCSPKPGLLGATCVTSNECTEGSCRLNACECRYGKITDYVNLNCYDDPCNINPCSHSGTCISEGRSYKCRCRDGLTGSNCETDVNECASNPCKNGATCRHFFNRYTCTCPRWYAGVNCERNLFNNCACGNGGTCLAKFDVFTCKCRLGYTGYNCGAEDICDHNPCRNYGTCISHGHFYKCTCRGGYTGFNCETDIDDCASNPCKNGGTCTDEINGYKCSCADGFEGFHCKKGFTIYTIDGTPRRPVSLGNCKCPACNTSEGAYRETVFENVVYNKETIVSSFGGSSVPPCAATNGLITGETSALYIGFRSSDNDQMPWIIIDLQNAITFDQFVLYKWFQDSREQDRFLGLDVLIDGRVIKAFPSHGEAGGLSNNHLLDVVITMTEPETGRYLTVQRREGESDAAVAGSNMIRITEIAIWVCKPNTWGNRYTGCQKCPEECAYACDNHYGCQKVLYNVAVRKPTSKNYISHAQGNYGHRDNIVDGITAGTHPSNCLVMRFPTYITIGITWHVQLGAKFKIEYVYITARKDCCGADYMKDFWVLVLPQWYDVDISQVTSKGENCAYQRAGLPTKTRKKIECVDDRVGTVVMLYGNSGVLGVCEFEAFGYRIYDVQVEQRCNPFSRIAFCERAPGSATFCEGNICRRTLNSPCTDDSQCGMNDVCAFQTCKSTLEEDKASWQKGLLVFGIVTAVVLCIAIPVAVVAYVRHLRQRKAREAVVTTGQQSPKQLGELKDQEEIMLKANQRENQREIQSDSSSAVPSSTQPEGSRVAEESPGAEASSTTEEALSEANIQSEVSGTDTVSRVAKSE